MKKVKQLLWVLSITLFTLLLVPNNVKALENPEDIIKRIAPDGKNAVFKVKKPTSLEEGDYLINGYVNNLLQLEGYEVYAGCYEEPYTKCMVNIRNDDYDSTWEDGEEKVISGWKGSYELDVTYDEPKENAYVDRYNICGENP